MKKHSLFWKYASKMCKTIFSIVGDFFLLVEKPLLEVLHDTKRSSKRGYFKIVGKGDVATSPLVLKIEFTLKKVI
nr:hypothetical protein [uncultured Agathobacter sp.]